MKELWQNYSGPVLMTVAIVYEIWFYATGHCLGIVIRF